MTQKVSDEKLGEFARRQNDWFRRVREGSLDPDEVAQAVQQIIDRPYFQRDMRKEGWELVEDVEGTQFLSPHQLELVPFLFKGENYIKGEELVERAKKMQANLGQRQAEYLLDHRYEIPEEWRQYYIVFPGTFWRDHYGYRNFPYLYWDGERWDLNFDWIVFVFISPVRLLRPRE